MPSKITKNGRIQWKGRVQKNGKIRQKHFHTKKEALNWENEERQKDWSKTDTEFSLGEWAQHYLDYSRKFSGKAYGEKKKAFKEFFAAKDRNGIIVDPEADVSTLTSGMVLRALQVQFRSRSGYAANKDRKNLVAAWNWGVKYLGLPTNNPCLVDKFPEVREERYVPPEEDFWKVYEVAEGQDQVMLLTFLHLGARRGEIFKLKWTDVDFPSGRIRLATRKRKDGTLEFDWLPMTQELKSKLLWWWENRTFKRHDYVFVCEEEYHFCKEHYGKPFTNRQHFMKRMCKKAGVPHFGFHAIRHLTASILYRLGKPVGAIQAILRHKHASTTERYLRSLGLEETRSHLEDLCGRGKVLDIKSHLEKHSQVAC
ncbi:tyrosine-type recombinase/integrase [Desulfonatronovibrio magnus]|uniref:tyrosine-type recombinase/integrase n=1 Tax=Desulfonatronovibrio magnus TaxID=698827 RepID=UPI0005EB6ADE|nr:site-specific integrase [Desulfonatronovibrio magnus]